MVNYPEIFRVRQRFESRRVADVAAEVEAQLARLQLAQRVRPGQTVAITAGSRGVANIHLILRATVAHLARLGAKPFIVPAMGSHAGGTAEGQRALIESYGITEDFVGCPIRSSMETVVVCHTPEGFPVHFDRCAYEADHVLVVNRIKPHTRFAGDIESGLMKMLLIGLGKCQGARVYHTAIQDYSFGQIIRSVAGEVFRRCHILAGLAIVENAYDQTALIEAVAPTQFEDREKALLTLAKQWMPRLPFDRVDLLLVDRIGKDISGAGLDTNVVGRKFEDHKAAQQEFPKVRAIAVRGLSPHTHGNAIGLGFAEFCKTQVLRETDLAATRLNALTASHASAAMLPLDYATDREILDAALPVVASGDTSQARLLWIADTLDLAELECSSAYLDEARGRDDLEILTRLRPLPLDKAGHLPDVSALPALAANGLLAVAATPCLQANRLLRTAGQAGSGTLADHIEACRQTAELVQANQRLQREIEQREQVEQRLRESETRYRVISQLTAHQAYSMRIAPDGSFVRDWAMSEMSGITGYTPAELDAVDWVGVVYDEDRPIFQQRRQRLLAGQQDVAEFRVVAKDGRIRWVRDYSLPIWDEQQQRVVRVFGASRDITEQKQTEEALRRAERLASIGTLAAGIAHEINNPLHGIVLSAEVAVQARRRPDGEQILDQVLPGIQSEALRCGRIVKSVLQFARQEVSQRWPCDLGQIARRSRDLVRKLAAQRRVMVLIEQSGQLPEVVVNPTEMEQVFVNLLSNALEASQPDSVVTVRLEALADTIGVQVIDQGRGMSREEADRILDPFYTTRQQEGGTGLGLSITYGIVQQHGGTIDVRTAPGRGTTMSILLPVAATSGPAKPA
jgi:PAS domain S-box-containing protein